MAEYTKIGRIRPDYADTWDASRSYTALEMVKSADSYHAYIAKQDVPAGTPLTNAEYWGEVLDVSDVIAESVAATNRANTAAANADAAREGIQDDLNGLHDELRTKADGILCTAEGETITLTDASDDPMRGLVLFGKTTYDGEPSPENPVTLVNKGDKGSITVQVNGRNLLNPVGTNLSNVGYDAVTGTIVSRASENMQAHTVKIQKYKDGYFVDSVAALLENGVHSIKYRHSSDTDHLYVGFNGDVMDALAAFDISNLYTDVDYYINFTVSGLGVNTGTISGLTISLEPQSVTVYEPYKSAQTLTALTPNGLPGIKVSSGGNYTDSSGQQWVGDERDLGNSVHVKRAHIQYFGGSENWYGGTTLDHVYYTTRLAYIVAPSSPTLNSHGYYDKGSISVGTMYISGTNNDEVYVYPDSDLFPTVESWKSWLAEQQASGTPFGIGFVLATPIETPLPAEEIAAYRALHTNKPNTTIYNDEGAHMEVSYNADTKTYIDNKISELAAAIVNTNA